MSEKKYTFRPWHFVLMDMPTVKVKSDTKIEENYKAGASRAQVPYTDAVKVADWKDPAGSDTAQSKYVTQMTNPTILARRKTGIAMIPNADWQKAAAEKGGPRIGPGMTAAAPKQIKNVKPYLDVIRSFDYPPRTLDGGVNVDNRVKGPALALMAKKRELKGG